MTAKNYVVCCNPEKVVKLKMHVLQLLMYKSHNIMSLLGDIKLVSCNKSVDLTGILSYRAAMFECLRHNLLSL